MGKILQTIKEDKTNFFKYIIAGTVGFGIGGVCWYGICRIISDSNIFSTGIIENLIFNITSGALFGASGALFISLLFKRTKKLFQFILFSSSGFAIGTVVSYLVILFGMLFVVFDIIPHFLLLFIGMAAGGTIGGFFLGFNLNKKNWYMIIAGAMSWGIGTLIIGLMESTEVISLFPISFIDIAYRIHLASFITIGLITGASLGAGMYFVEKFDAK